MNKRKQMSESILLGSLLAIVGGFLDVYTYLIRGNVFANAQTGNIVFLGLKLSSGDWLGGLYYAVPICAFAMGIILVEIIKKRFKAYPKIHWRQIIVAIEIVLLCIASLIPSGDFDVVVNIGISFICAMQVETFRRVEGNAFATTMCTGNLRSATEFLFRYIDTKDKENLKSCIRYYSVILFFILGAVLSVVITTALAEKAVVFCVLVLIIVFVMMFFNREDL